MIGRLDVWKFGRFEGWKVGRLEVLKFRSLKGGKELEG